MSIGTWEPTGPIKIDLAKLRQLVDISLQLTTEADLKDCLSPDVISENRQLMKQPADAWGLATALTDEELISNGYMENV